MILGRACYSWAACGLLLGAPILALADSHLFDIPAQPLPSALKAFAAQAHVQLLYVYSAVASGRGNAVRGEMDTRQALDELLRGTGFEASYTSDTEVTIRRASEAGPADTGVPAGKPQVNATRTWHTDDQP